MFLARTNHRAGQFDPERIAVEKELRRGRLVLRGRRVVGMHLLISPRRCNKAHSTRRGPGSPRCTEVTELDSTDVYARHRTDCSGRYD